MCGEKPPVLPFSFYYFSTAPSIILEESGLFI